MRAFFPLLGLVLVSLGAGAAERAAEGSWFCESGASEKRDRIITACGVDTDPTENGARKKALAAAFEELDAVCDRSADCKSFELEIEPMRSDCRKKDGAYKCYRAIRATITRARRKEEFKKGETLKPERDKIEVTVKVEQPPAVVYESERWTNSHGCTRDLEPFKRALLDLTTEDKRKAMVKEALLVPFDGKCGEAHYKAISLLERHGLELPEYSAFLRKTLDEIKDTSADGRAETILEYFKKVGGLTDKKWEAGLATLKKTPSGHLYRVLPEVIADDVTGEEERKRQMRRVDLFVEAARRGEIGKPTPIPMDDVMELMLRSFRSHEVRRNPWLALYAYDKHQGILSPAKAPQAIESLILMDREIEDPAAKAKVVGWIADRVKKGEPGPEIARQLDPYLRDFDRKIAKFDDEEEEGMRMIKLYRELRATLISRAGPNLGKSLAMTERDYERRSRAQLCIELQIECGELVPDAGRLAKLLKSRKARKRGEALELLVKMPAVAAKLEGELLEHFKEIEGGAKLEGTHYTLADDTEAVFAAIPTRNPEALRMIVERHARIRQDLSRVSAKLGPQLEPLLVKELKGVKADAVGHRHVQVIDELGKFARLGKVTCQALEEWRGRKEPYYLAERVEKALQRCP